MTTNRYDDTVVLLHEMTGEGGMESPRTRSYSGGYTLADIGPDGVETTSCPPPRTARPSGTS